MRFFSLPTTHFPGKITASSIIAIIHFTMSMSVLSCQRSTMLAAQNKSPFLRRFRSFKPYRSRFRCLLDQIAAPTLLTSDNVIAAAKAASAHSAVSSAITQVAVTAVAIASGACLSTKFDFLWPKLQEQPGFFCLFSLSLFFYFLEVANIYTDT